MCQWEYERHTARGELFLGTDELTPFYLVISYIVKFFQVEGDLLSVPIFLHGAKEIPIDAAGNLILDGIDFTADLRLPSEKDEGPDPFSEA